MKTRSADPGEPEHVFWQTERFASVRTDCLEYRVAIEKPAIVRGDECLLGSFGFAVHEDDAHGSRAVIAQWPAARRRPSLPERNGPPLAC